MFQHACFFVLTVLTFSKTSNNKDLHINAPTSTLLIILNPHIFNFSSFWKNYQANEEKGLKQRG